MAPQRETELRDHLERLRERIGFDVGPVGHLRGEAVRESSAELGARDCVRVYATTNSAME